MNDLSSLGRIPFRVSNNAKDKGEPLPPGFWIGLILVLILLYFTERCKNGTL